MLKLKRSKEIKSRLYQAKKQAEEEEGKDEIRRKKNPAKQRDSASTEKGTVVRGAWPGVVLP